MTQQDKDRESFELAWEQTVVAGHTYPAEAKEWAFLGWQAARDRYAPKLTKEQATVALARFAALQEYHAHGFETINSPDVYVGIAYKDHIDNARKEIESLSAAGMRFREEA